MYFSSFVVVLLLSFTFQSSAQPSSHFNQNQSYSQSDLVRVANLMAHTFSNEKQKAEEDVVGTGEQRIIGKRVWKKYEDQGTWVFVRWFSMETPEKPLTTVFLNFQSGSEDTMLMQIYPVPEEIYLEGKYQKPNSEEPYLDCTPNDLIEISNCGYPMVKKGAKHFEVFHNHNYCPFENGYSPVPYFDIQMRIKEEALHFNTAFFNLNQEKVFQYVDQVYEPLK